MVYEKLKPRIQNLSDQVFDEVVAIRRNIHQNPELSFREARTAALVAGKLEEYGLAVTRGIVGTGVVGVLNGKNPGKTIALRADMDALPLQEETGLPFKSHVDGVMHACGHDFHTANLLGAAKILSQLRDDIAGTVKFIFQPGEESGGGGREMVKEGGLDNPKVDAILAIHVLPAPLGYLSLGYGPTTAFSDKITLLVKGKKTHASTPQEGVDALVIAAQIVTALQTVVSRQVDPLDAATFSLGQINGGTAPNIMPDLVEMVGTMRTLHGDTRERIKNSIEKIASSIAAGMGGACEVVCREGYPSVINDKAMTDLIKDVAAQVYDMVRNAEGLLSSPTADLIKFDKPRLASEDFGFYAHRVPACLAWIGVGGDVPLHSPYFSPDENAFKLTLNILSGAAIKYLSE